MKKYVLAIACCVFLCNMVTAQSQQWQRVYDLGRNGARGIDCAMLTPNTGVYLQSGPGKILHQNLAYYDLRIGRFNVQTGDTISSQSTNVVLDGSAAACYVETHNLKTFVFANAVDSNYNMCIRRQVYGATGILEYDSLVPLTESGNFMGQVTKIPGKGIYTRTNFSSVTQPSAVAIHRFDLEGRYLWRRTFQHPRIRFRGYSIEPTLDSNILLTRMDSLGMRTLKINALTGEPMDTGFMVPFTELGLQTYTFYNVKQCPDGGYLISSNSSGANTTRLLMKLDSNKRRLWRLNPRSYDIERIAVQQDNSFVAIGTNFHLVSADGLVATPLRSGVGISGVNPNAFCHDGVGGVIVTGSGGTTGITQSQLGLMRFSGVGYEYNPALPLSTRAAESGAGSVRALSLTLSRFAQLCWPTRGVSGSAIAL